MKTLFFELNMGAAGDMISASLLELLSTKEKKEFLEYINHIGVPNVTVSTETVTRAGISGTKIHVIIDGHEEGHHHDHEHHHHTHSSHASETPLHVGHEHHHEHNHHHHASMHDIEHIIGHLSVSDKIKKEVVDIYKIIAQAESKAHGCEVSEIHFHEVGMMDAIMDVTMCCLLIEKLAPDRILSTPIHVGRGTVKCAHGIMPVPAPATVEILKNVPIYSKDVDGELCTPTGAAVMKYFVNEYKYMPTMSVIATGYGMGTKDFDGSVNCVRTVLGESFDSDSDSVYILECNLDDMTPEEAGFALEVVMESGAKEAFFTPVTMKKSRVGFVMTVICDEDKKDDIVSLIFKHTSTIGIRQRIESRYTLKRSTTTVDTEYGPIRKKISEGYGVIKEKYEYDDLVKIAREKEISIKMLKTWLNI